MISVHKFNKKNNINITTTTNIQKTISNKNNLTSFKQNMLTNYLLSNKTISRNKQNNNGSRQLKTVKDQNTISINDQNSSYQANFITHSNTQPKSLKQFLLNQSKGQNLDQFNCQNQPISQNLVIRNNQHNSKQLTENNKPSEIGSKVVNLKKKIKKCTHDNTKYNFFRQKITFKKKIYNHQSSNISLISQSFQQNINDRNTSEQPNIKIQQETHTFYIYRDNQIFKSLKSKQLINKIVIQRMDNDTETDDEQVQKFVKKISTDLLAHIKKVQNQQSTLNKLNSITQQQSAQLQKQQ